MGKRKPALTFAETDYHGDDEDLKPSTSATRRSRRNGNTYVQQSEPINKADTANSSDDDFVTLPSTAAVAATAAATTPSSSLPAQRGQRQRIQLKNQQQQKAEHRDDEVLRQQEEDDILRAIELSKLEMEAERQHSENREEWGSALPLDSQEPSSDSQSPEILRKFVSSRAGAVGVPSPKEPSKNNTTESLSSSSSVVSTDCEDGTTPEKVVQARADQCTEWQDMIGSADWEDPSQPVGVATCERGTQPIDSGSKTGGRNESPKGQTSQSQSSSHTITASQSSQVSGRDRLRRRKRHMEKEVDSLRTEQPAKVRKVPVPTPPDLDETEEEEEEEEEEEVKENDVVKEEEAMSGQEDLRETQQSSPMEPPREVHQLVDTRKPRCARQSFYAPRNATKRSYTREIYQLLQAYCCRLRRAQANVVTRVGWGNPIITGNCYSDTLVHRKRGSRDCTFYTLSDSEEDDDQAPAAGKEVEAPSKSKLQRRKKKLVVDVEDDPDSDFDEFIPADRRKASTQRRPRLAAQDVVEMLKQDGRCFLEERPDEIPSPTLVQDQTETQDFATVPSNTSVNSDSDFSQPIVGETPSSRGIHDLDDSKKSPRIQMDSQSSLTDIFGASSNNETDSGTKAGTSGSQQSARSHDSGHRAEEKSENGCEEDSFDEEIRTLSTAKLDSRAESIKPSLQEDVAQMKSADSTQDSQSLNKQLGNTAANRHDKEKPLVPLWQRDMGEANNPKGSSLLSSGPLDPSQNYSPPQKSASAQGLSFEELRYQFYQSKPALERLKRSGKKTDGEEYASHLDNTSRDEQSVEHPRAKDLEERSQQTKDSITKTSVKVRREQERRQRITNGLQDSVHKRRSLSSVDKRSSVITSRSASEDEGEITDCESPTDGGSQDDGRLDTRESEPDRGRKDSGNRPRGDDAKDSEEELEAKKRREGPENVQSEDDADDWDGWEEGQDEFSATEPREATEAVNDEVPLPPEDVLEEEDAIGDTHHSSAIGVECPLCSVKYHIDQIEAHASGCNGPTSPQLEDGRVGHAQVPGEPTAGVKPVMTRGQLNPYHNRTSTVSDNNRGLAGPSTAGTQNHRDLTADGHSKLRPIRGVAAKIVREDVPKHNNHPSQDSVLRKRRDPDHDPDEESSESFSESADQLDASLLQLVEDNKLQMRDRKRTRVPDRPAKRQKLSSAAKRSKETEDTELCFLCNQQIPKSTYAVHVQEEIDREEAKKNLEDTSAPPRRDLRPRTTGTRAAGGESSREADHNTDQSGTTSAMSHTADDFSSWGWEPDKDSDSDDSQTAQEDALFNSRLSESPIKAFRPISKQPMNLIDFQNQFNSTGNAAWTGISSRSTGGKRGGRGQGKGRRGGKRKQKKKGGRYFKK